VLDCLSDKPPAPVTVKPETPKTDTSKKTGQEIREQPDEEVPGLASKSIFAPCIADSRPEYLLLCFPPTRNPPFAVFAPAGFFVFGMRCFKDAELLKMRIG